MDVNDVVQIAEITLGGPVAVRDYGLIQSAIGRPQGTVFGVDAYPTLLEKAAALLHSVSSNHGLVDGNKRTGWACTIVFLEINGLYLLEPLDEDAAEDLVLAVAQSQLANEEIAERLNKFVTAEPPAGL